MNDRHAGVHLAPFGSFGHVRDWVFDLDNTLYPAECDLFAEIDTRMTDFVSRLLDLPPDEARKVQKQYYAAYGTTLSGLMEVHKLDPQKFLSYVHDIDLSPLPDLPALRSALEKLPGRKFVYTNGSRGHAERVTEKMGLAHVFNGSFGIEDAAYTPKPRPASYAAFNTMHGVDPHGAIFFEDLARNLAPAKDIGFTTVLVHSEKDWSHEPVEARPANLQDLLGDDGPDHIDYVTGDLAAFLEAALKTL
ncbi:pyrimidine 5'-nucleotidase [Hyphomonas johnsonii]|uniref:Pyrimidine 5'-nucleotidase n=1 Tax=Hyphomonas johnsonii MHS-2 TaxID=1280950 RepID=A0A059FN98_9PROT|nr:pyrimidine 5'-nucleotidase [Hyphomonas johnsonii]KCZ92109.1 pyrimidine 5'-nucleotidase [Hyphomonas johnsonii MHS-2]